MANPDGVEVLRVSGYGKFDLSVWHELLGQVQLELDEEKVGGDDNDTVLFLVEEDVLDGTWDFAYFRAVLEVISKAY